MILGESVDMSVILLTDKDYMSSDLAVVDVGITTAGVGGGVGDSLVIVLVFIISGSVRRWRFSGLHPWSLMAFIFVLFCPKDFGHMILTKDYMSLFSCLKIAPRQMEFICHAPLSVQR